MGLLLQSFFEGLALPPEVGLKIPVHASDLRKEATVMEVVPGIEKNIRPHGLELQYEGGAVEHDEVDPVPPCCLHAVGDERDHVVGGLPPIGIDDDAKIKVAAVPFAIGRDGPEEVRRPHGRVIRKDVSEPMLSGLGKHDGGASETKRSLSA
jgi:hypothetical protein